MTRLDADCLESRRPLGAGAAIPKAEGFQAHHVDLIVPKPELFNERTGLSVNLAPPEELAVMVEHANSGFVQRDVEANNLTHGSLRSIAVGCEPSGESGRRPITHAIQWQDAAQEPSCHVSTLCRVQREQAAPQQAGSGRPLR